MVIYLGSNIPIFIKEALSVLVLYAPVFIFTSDTSALLGHPWCGLSIFTVSTCHIQYTFLSLWPFFFSQENRQNTKNIRSLPCSYDMKMSVEGY